MEFLTTIFGSNPPSLQDNNYIALSVYSLMLINKTEKGPSPEVLTSDDGPFTIYKFRIARTGKNDNSNRKTISVLLIQLNDVFRN